ncbi:MAG: ATP-dependent zinc metalloprotease FtsH [Chloroflexi bacterium]|nr:MAG: ATP-dependent zinc metalloprotease FtsH [Chloroflexota bacterium]
MDGKSGRRSKSMARLRRYTDVRSNGRNVLTFLKTHKQALFTGVLLVMVIGLIFGVVSQLQAPSTNTSPNGVTVISYSTFVEQVKTGNVQAVTLQGNDINGLLITPLSQHQTLIATKAATVSASKMTADFAAWSRYVGSGYSSWPSTSASPPVDPARAVFTHLPGSGDANFMPMLLSHNVIVNTLPVAQSPIWMGLLWRFVPLLFFGLILLLVIAPKNSMRSNRAMDDRVTQLGKSRARRFDRTTETKQSRIRPDKFSSSNSVKSNGASSAKTHTSLEPHVTFEDVAGIDEVRVELEEIVQFLRSPERYGRLGARIPRGALLVGPPGTGKTLLAKAVAGEAGVPFFSMSASEFVEMFVGVGASRVRDLFNQARQSAPCVVFIDEIDAVGRKRSMRLSGNDERDQTLNQLLVELDGFDGHKAVVVLAATNRVDILDKALLRPGRFDRHITVSHPDRVGREAILKVHTRFTPLHEDVSLERLSRLTTGMTGADLANLVNEAALCAARQNLEHITHDCFEDALARVQLGALRPIVMSETDRRIIAYHEGGHALVAYHLPQADTVNRVTILPRGQSLGVTQFTAEEDRYNYSRETIMARIAVGLGGRVAEELTFGPERVTTGAENDLQVVTDLARRMVTRWGMSEQVGVVFADYEPGAMSLNMRRSDVDDLPAQSRSFVVGADGQLTPNGGDAGAAAQRHEFAMNAPATRGNNSATMASMIDFEVQNILKEGYAMARGLLSEHYEQLKKLANTLMEREQLDRKQFEAVVQE